MNKKVLGSSLRRGVLTGTVAGFVAGWSAFVGHGKQLDVVQLAAWQEVAQKTADLALPPIPGLPQLPAVPATTAYRVRYGPDQPLPRVTGPNVTGVSATAGPVATAAPGVFAPPVPAQIVGPSVPAPTFAPLPALPPAPARPAPTTKASPPHK